MLKKIISSNKKYYKEKKEIRLYGINRLFIIKRKVQH